MTSEAYPPVFAFLLLVAIAILWSFARKDLNARAAEKHAPTVAELEKVRATVEELLDVLEERAGSIERRLSTLVEEAHAILVDSGHAKPHSALRLDPPSEPKPELKPSRSRGATVDQFVVIETEPTVSAPAEANAGELAQESENRGVIQPSPEPEHEIPDVYRQVYALSDGGMDDIVEIAKRTGLGQSEVEMVLSLRDRGI